MGVMTLIYCIYQCIIMGGWEGSRNLNSFRIFQFSLLVWNMVICVYETHGKSERRKKLKRFEDEQMKVFTSLEAASPDGNQDLVVHKVQAHGEEGSEDWTRMNDEGRGHIEHNNRDDTLAKAANEGHQAEVRIIAAAAQRRQELYGQR